MCVNNNVESWLLWISQDKMATYYPNYRWGGHAIHVQFSQHLTCRKLLKSVNFWQSYLKNKKVDVFWDTGYMSHRPAGLYGSDICFIYVAYKSTYMNPWLICVLYILAYNIYVGIYVTQSRLCQHMWHFICLIYVCSVWVSPAYATIPSLVRYTNRPSRHKRRYRKSLTVVLTTP